MKMLSFLARGTKMVFDLDSNEAGIRRFIGRKHDRTKGFKGVDEHGNSFMSGGWPSTGMPHSVSARGEYLLACRNCDLWAADEETADYCGVAYDPAFGGEYEPETLPEAEHDEMHAMEQHVDVHESDIKPA